MFGEIGLDKLLMLLVMFLLLFGAKRLPEIGRSFGKGIREFKGSLAGLDEPADQPSTSRDVGAGAVHGILEAGALEALDARPLRRLEGK
jgi:sec-independent protein translocase protein TatA